MLPNLFHLHVLSYQLISYLCIIQMSDVRHFYSIPAPSQYGCNPFFQHQTGDDVASCSLASRLSLSSERSPISWFARHCSSKVSHGYFCSWVLLAWSQGMQKIHGSQIELRFLGGKGPPEQGARSRSMETIRSKRMVCNHCLGMPA